MSSEIQFRHTATGDTLYAVVIAPSSQWANITNSVFETMVVANWAEYAVSLTESPANGYFYIADFPAWIITEGDYPVLFYLQAGGSPAITDKQFRCRETENWDGTQSTSIAEKVKFLKDVAEGDNSMDTSNAAQFQSVVTIKGTATELIRKDLQETDGTPIITINTIIGIQVEP